MALSVDHSREVPVLLQIIKSDPETSHTLFHGSIKHETIFVLCNLTVLDSPYHGGHVSSKKKIFGIYSLVSHREPTKVKLRT